MKKLNVATRRGSVLNGALFDTPGADTVLVNITGGKNDLVVLEYRVIFQLACKGSGTLYTVQQPKGVFQLVAKLRR